MVDVSETPVSFINTWMTLSSEFDRKDRIVTEDDDKHQEEQKVVRALKTCGYPQWTFKKVKDQMKVPKKQNTSKKVDSTNKSRLSRGMVVVPYTSKGCLNMWPEFISPTVLQPYETAQHPPQRTCAS